MHLSQSVPLKAALTVCLPPLSVIRMPPPHCSVGRLKRPMAEICVKAVLAVADLPRRDVNLDLIKVGPLGLAAGSWRLAAEQGQPCLPAGALVLPPDQHMHTSQLSLWLSWLSPQQGRQAPWAVSCTAQQHGWVGCASSALYVCCVPVPMWWRRLRARSGVPWRTPGWLRAS